MSLTTATPLFKTNLFYFVSSFSLCHMKVPVYKALAPLEIFSGISEIFAVKSSVSIEHFPKLDNFRENLSKSFDISSKIIFYNMPTTC